MDLRRRPPFSLFAFLSLLVLLAACGGEGSGPITAASMVAPGGNSVTGTVGQALLVEIVVTGSNGKPFAGGVVSFSVTSGGGSVSPSQANTDKDGKASTTWTLGTSSGNQTISASSDGASTLISASAQAGLPALVESVSSFPGQFLPGVPLTQPAAFLVRDQFNNPVPGVSVVFSASNGGTVNPSQANTGADGRASTIWTMGMVNGLQTVTASVANVTPGTVTAEAYDPCLDIRDYTIGQSANGLLTSESCEIEFDNEVRFADLYQFTLRNTGAYRFTVTSSFLNPFLLLFDPGAVAGQAAEAGTSVSLKVFLDNGGSMKRYYPWIASDAGGVGSYTLTSGTTVGAMTGCEAWASTKTLSTNQAVSPEDCTLATGGETYFADLLTVWLDPGETLVVTQSSTFFDTRLWLLVKNGPGDYTIIAENDDFGGTSNSRLVYTAPVPGFFVIAPSSYVPGAFGAYAMTISSSGGSQSPGLADSPTRLPFEMLPVPARDSSEPIILRPGSRPIETKKH